MDIERYAVFISGGNQDHVKYWRARAWGKTWGGADDKVYGYLLKFENQNPNYDEFPLKQFKLFIYNDLSDISDYADNYWFKIGIGESNFLGRSYIYSTGSGSFDLSQVKLGIFEPGNETPLREIPLRIESGKWILEENPIEIYVTNEIGTRDKYYINIGENLTTYDNAGSYEPLN